MLITLCSHILSVSLIAPAATTLPAGTSSLVRGPQDSQVALLHARFDPSLESLRGGSVLAGPALGSDERAELVAAQQRAPSLDALRGGSEPSDNEWKWLAIGAAIVLLIVLI